MKQILIICLFCIFCLSCKKHLIKDKSVLIGEWEWMYSKYSNDTIYPNIQTFKCEIDFKKKGKVTLYKNSKLICENKTKFLQFEKLKDTIYFSISLKEGFKSDSYYFDNNILSGRLINESNLQINNYPYSSIPFNNIFVKK